MMKPEQIENDVIQSMMEIVQDSQAFANHRIEAAGMAHLWVRGPLREPDVPENEDEPEDES